MLANDVDLHHPWIFDKESLILYGNGQTDLLQTLVDSLTETGRLNDNKLGHYFWKNWILCLTYEQSSSPNNNSNKKRKRKSNPTTTNANLKLGSLCLHNANIADDTIEHMVEAGVGPHLLVLDLTGIRNLTDHLCHTLLSTCGNLTRLSLKNCRKLSQLDFLQYTPHLTALDIGGCCNMVPSNVLEMLTTHLPNKQTLTDFHASGLPWTDDEVQTLCETFPLTHLSIGFCTFNQTRLRTSLKLVSETLLSLALPFCEATVDNTLLGILGRNLPRLECLDVRGNVSLTTVSGFYDGRASADLEWTRLVVLGRYSGITENSVEETKRIHPQIKDSLTVILNAGGMGAGIMR